MEFQPFRLFDFSHLGTLLVVTFLAIGTSCFAKRNISGAQDKLFRMGLAFLLIINEAFINLWAFQAGEWSYTWALPLHLCDLSLVMLVVALMVRNQIAWELAYYWGLGGSVPAMLTPDLPISFPHFYYITFFVHHAGVVLGSLYLAFSGKYPLPFISIKRVWLITHGYAAVIAAFNMVMGTNYLFLCAKPSRASVLDFLGPWPVYVLGLEAIFTITLFVLWRLFQLIPELDQNSRT